MYGINLFGCCGGTCLVMSTTQEEAESVPKPDDVLDQPREAMPSPDGQEEDDEELDPRVKASAHIPL